MKTINKIGNLFLIAVTIMLSSCDNDDQEINTQSVYTDTASCEFFESHVLLFYPALNILTTNKFTYTINYPVDIIINGQLITLQQDSDYLPAIGGNPMRFPKGELVYPITINQFGQTITLNSNQDVCDFRESLNEDCVNKPAHIQFFFKSGSGPISCAYYINYPVNVTFNGNHIAVQNFNEYNALLNGNQNVYNGLSLVYPLNITKFANDETVAFTSDSDICAYLNNCN